MMSIVACRCQCCERHKKDGVSVLTALRNNVRLAKRLAWAEGMLERAKDLITQDANSRLFVLGERWLSDLERGPNDKKPQS